MTPEQHARVKEAFHEALQLPEAQRRDWVENRFAAEPAIRGELLSLLRHHHPRTLLPAAALPPERAAIEVAAPLSDDSFLVLNDVWQENRQVLRSRLLVFSSVLAILIAMSNARLFTYFMPTWGYAVRLITLFTCLGCAAVLYSRPRIALSHLRLIEFALLGSVGLLMFSIHCRLMLELTAIGDDATVIGLNHWSYFSWSLLIMIYGVFLPNTWQRAAAVAAPLACGPALTVYAATRLDPRLPDLLDNDTLGMPLPTTWVAAAVAIAAAKAIHGARLSAFQARRLAQYRLKRLIGEGGMGRVYEAEHLLLKRPCAIKVIRPELSRDREALTRFEREVKAAAQLTHPHTIEIYDYGESRDGVFFFAMELLPGCSLRQLVEEYGPLEPARVLHLMIQVGQALQEAHAAGLVHRDIKPENIFASQRGGIPDFAKLLDFGIVGQHRPDSGDAPRETVVAGTPAYMAPEQIATPGDVDARSDLYSLGAVAFYLLTGGPAFSGGDAWDVLQAQLRGEWDAERLQAANPPEDLRRVVERCLARAPQQRFASAEALVEALQQCEQAGSWTPHKAVAWWARRAAEEAAER